MKFHCLCLSPAIDATVSLPEAPRGSGEVFKDVPVVENVGGKGLNVARWLALRGATVSCGGILGEENARPFEEELKRYGIGDKFLRVPGATRRNEMITWPGGSFKINRPAFPGLSADGLEIELSDLDSGDVLVLSGSLPQDFPADYYARLIAACQDRDVTTVLDASGASLVAGVNARPDVIKPNADECVALIGFVPKMPSEFQQATRLLKEKVSYPIISDGGNGCWFDGTFVPSPKVDVVDTTAAGDTLLAEWCFSHDPARAVAAGSAACTMPGSQPPNPLSL